MLPTSAASNKLEDVSINPPTPAAAKAATPGRERSSVYHLFADALELEEDLREQFLARECHGDPQSRSEVEDLLRIAMNDPTATRALLSDLRPQQAEDLLGREYGRFRLIELIGAGGMGVVYRAERSDGVQQSVAIKLASRTVTAAAQLRFQSEAQTLARLEHAAVARLIDAGVENGRAWIAMEFVAGERIDKYCRSRNLSSREIIKLIVQLADAVSAAHRLLVVHSDIKPANVLVTPEGVPKLIDFGIATAARAAGDISSSVTAEDLTPRLFSPGFAAPEQVTGEGVTAATDVFGLGALAYHLLSGSAPHASDDQTVPYAQAVTSRDVARASQTAAVAGHSPSQVRQLRGDLDAILAKALARNPKHRYLSAAELRADFVRFLERRPVKARRAGVVYRFGRFTQRNSWACGLAFLLLASLCAGGVAMVLQMHRESLARNMAARRDEFLESLLKSADPRGGRRDISVAEMLDAAASELDAKLASEPLVEASMLGVIAQTYNGLGRYAEGQTANDRQLALLRDHSASDAELGQALALRGELLREQGKWFDAEPALREAVTLLRTGRTSAELCEALYVLGVVQAHVNEEAAAQRTYQEVIDIESLGDQRLQQRRMFPYHAMAINLANMGRYDEALVYAREAVQVAQQWLPADHPDMLPMESTYAGALVNTHRYAEAEALFTRVIAQQTRVLGENHKDTLLTQLLYADELLELRRNVEARELASSVARKLELQVGTNNLYTQMAWQTYGSALCNNGQLDEGLETLYRVESVWRRMRPATDRLVHGTDLSLGECLYRAHRYMEAEGTLLASAAGLEAASGPAYRRTQEAYRSLRDLYTDTGRARDALSWSAKLNP